MEQSPWLCHICNHKGKGESSICDICYQVTCPEHLAPVAAQDEESGLLVLRRVCPHCRTLDRH